MLSTLLLLTSAVAKPSSLPHRKLVFSCDFRKVHHLSTRDWKFDDGPVFNNEQERYVSGEGPNARLSMAGLTIVATKKDGKVMSARIQSVHAWKYGYVEVTAKVPPGRGTWPAIWMLNDSLRAKRRGNPGWPKCGEIDIMENVGYDPNSFHFSLHSQKFNFMRHDQRTKVIPCANPTAWHKFALDWRPASITFLLDGKPVYRVDKTEDTVDSWPFRDPFYLILNLAIGGNWGGAKGVDDGIFPAKFVIRDVKVYQ